jgi:hypothetical protein
VVYRAGDGMFEGVLVATSGGSQSDWKGDDRSRRVTAAS